MVNLLNGHLVYFGNRGYGWSSIARVYSSLTTANAYGLDFYTSGIRPSYDQNYRFRGLPVRCLVILVLVCVGELEPLYFVRSGNIRLDLANTLKGPGSDGNGWSSTVSNYRSPDVSSAYYFAFSTLETWPTLNYMRYCGFPVRCLVY